MRELVLKMSMSLDGFVAGVDGNADWVFGADSEAAPAGQLEDLSGRCGGADLSAGLSTTWKACAPHRRSNWICTAS